MSNVKREYTEHNTRLKFAQVRSADVSGMECHLCQYRIAAEARKIDCGVQVLLDLPPTSFSNEMQLLRARVQRVAVWAGAGGIRRIDSIDEDAVFHRNVLEHGHKLPVFLGATQTDSIFIVLMLRRLREKVGRRRQPTCTRRYA